MSIKCREGSENWYYRFSYKRIGYCEGGFRTKTQAIEAERLALDALIQAAAHPEDRASGWTFRQAGEWWMTQYASQKSNSPDRYRVPILVAYFGDRKMKDIQPEDIDTFLAKLSTVRERTIKDLTRNHYLALIKAIYNRMIRKGIYKGFNPALAVDMIKVAKARTRFLYPAEEKSLTPAVAHNVDVWPYYYLGLETGMRIDEMRNLRLKHVDLSMQHLFIEFGKGNQSRYVPLTSDSLAFLGGYIANKGSEDFLLPHRHGYTWLLRELQAIAKSVGIEDIGFHVMRHTFAYHKLTAGVPIYIVSKLMGHSSVTVTEKHYGHLAQADLRKAIESVKPFISYPRLDIGKTDFGL